MFYVYILYKLYLYIIFNIPSIYDQIIFIMLFSQMYIYIVYIYWKCRNLIVYYGSSLKIKSAVKPVIHVILHVLLLEGLHTTMPLILIVDKYYDAILLQFFKSENCLTLLVGWHWYICNLFNYCCIIKHGKI